MPCLKCGALVRDASYCPPHQPVRDVRARGGGAGITRFRSAVLSAAGYRCQAVVAGRRCTTTGAANLEAHHLKAISAGGSNDAANGVALCPVHHALVEGRQPSRT
jgi:hypothetical protein